MRYFKSKISDKLALLGNEVFSTSNADSTIICFEDYFHKLGAPTRLHEIGIHVQHKNEVIENLIYSKTSGDNFKMDRSDFERIFDLML
jgi:alcohol dehydrogenase YqhD (iron-dependent ADH family)